MRAPRKNPFCVDRVSALPFVGGDVPALLDRFLSLRRGAIVGPHGVGKSTLMRSIGDGLRDRNVRTTAVVVPGSATRDERAAALAMIDTARPDAVVLLDGYEQLTWAERRHVRRRRRLLVTAHGRTRLPTLVALRPTIETWRAVLAELGVEMTPSDIATFAHHDGNVREALMTRFDLWAMTDEPRSMPSLTVPNSTQR